MKTTGASTGKAEPSSSASFEHCCVVVNYDLPWNPRRVEQRIGRCDRLGQASDKIHIRSLASEGTIESRILGRLYERLGIFERALGELEVVLGEAMADFERDLFNGGLTEQQQIERLEQTAQAIENRERHRESVTQSSVISTQGRHLIDSDQQEISDAETGFLSPDDLADFVYAALERHLPNTLRRTATAGQFRLVNSADLEDALKRLQQSYPAASNARTQIVRFRDRARRRATANVSFTGEHSEAEFGWNRRIEQETETKLDEIERRSGVRSSLEVIGMALLIPDSTQL